MSFCSEGFNPLLELAFQLNNNHLVNRDTPLKGFEYRTSTARSAAVFTR
jgi:hypothetical protein